MSEKKHRTPEEIQADKDQVMDEWGGDNITNEQARTKIRALDKELAASHAAALAEGKAQTEEEKKKAQQQDFDRRLAAVSKPIHEKAAKLAKRIFGEDVIAKNKGREKEVRENLTEEIVRRSGAAGDDTPAVIVFLEQNPNVVDEALATIHKDIYDGAEKNPKKKGKKEDRDDDVKKVKENQPPEGSGGNPTDDDTPLSDEDTKFADDIASGAAAASFASGQIKPRDAVRAALRIGQAMSQNTEAADSAGTE